MSPSVELGLALGLTASFCAILLGRNLTRSMMACTISIVGLVLAMLASGAGFVALFVGTVAALVLAIVQLFGWMLVDVDRDHLPRTDTATWLARSIAFILLGIGLVLLVLHASSQGDLRGASVPLEFAEPREIGALFFGPWRDLATLCGFALSAGLLGSLMLLSGDGEKR